MEVFAEQFRGLELFQQETFLRNAARYRPYKHSLYRQFGSLNQIDVVDHSQMDDVQLVILEDNVNELSLLASYPTFDFNQVVEYNQKLLTIISFAALSNALRCFKFLLINNAHLSFRIAQKPNWHSFHWAIAGGNEEIIQLVQERRKFPPGLLHVAALYHQNRIVEWLIDIQNFSTSQKFANHFPIESAACGGNLRGIEMLRQYETAIHRYDNAIANDQQVLISLSDCVFASNIVIPSAKMLALLLSHQNAQIDYAPQYFQTITDPDMIEVLLTNIPYYDVPPEKMSRQINMIVRKYRPVEQWAAYAVLSMHEFHIIDQLSEDLREQIYRQAYQTANMPVLDGMLARGFTPLFCEFPEVSVIYFVKNAPVPTETVPLDYHLSDSTLDLMIQKGWSITPAFLDHDFFVNYPNSDIERWLKYNPDLDSALARLLRKYTKCWGNIACRVTVDLIGRGARPETVDLSSVDITYIGDLMMLTNAGVSLKTFWLNEPHAGMLEYCLANGMPPTNYRAIVSNVDIIDRLIGVSPETVLQNILPLAGYMYAPEFFISVYSNAIRRGIDPLAKINGHQLLHYTREAKKAAYMIATGQTDYPPYGGIKYPSDPSWREPRGELNMLLARHNVPMPVDAIEDYITCKYNDRSPLNAVARPMIDGISLDMKLKYLHVYVDISDNWEKPDRDGNSLLLLACRHWKQYQGIVDALAIYGVDINCQNNEGKTAIYYAARNQHNAYINELVKSGCQVDAETARLIKCICSPKTASLLLNTQLL